MKQPDKTRQDILEAALWEIYRHGFQGASIDQIVARTGVTKGALYHHFPNKLALGYSVVDEVIRAWITDRWLRPLREAKDPVSGLRNALEEVLASASDEMLSLGCPLNNLMQEMSPLDEGFRQRLQRVGDEWRQGVADQLREGQEAGLVRRDLDPDAMAAFLVASFEGITGVAKNAQDRELARKMVGVLLGIIDGLRADPAVREMARV